MEYIGKGGFRFELVAGINGTGKSIRNVIITFINRAMMQFDYWTMGKTQK